MGMVIALVTQDPIILKIQMGWSKISLRYTMSRGWEIKQNCYDNPTVVEA